MDDLVAPRSGDAVLAQAGDHHPHRPGRTATRRTASTRRSTPWRRTATSAPWPRKLTTRRTCSTSPTRRSSSRQHPVPGAEAARVRLRPSPTQTGCRCASAWPASSTTWTRSPSASRTRSSTASRSWARWTSRSACRTAAPRSASGTARSTSGSARYHQHRADRRQLLDKLTQLYRLDEIGLDQSSLDAIQDYLDWPRHHPRHRSRRLRQDDDALCVDGGDRRPGRTSSDRGSGRVRRRPGQVRVNAEGLASPRSSLVPAPGSRRDDGR